MSTKKDKHKSLVHQLEDSVLALEQRGESYDDIFSMVHMILRGFIRGGELTPEYIELANKAIEAKNAGQDPEITVPSRIIMPD